MRIVLYKVDFSLKDAKWNLITPKLDQTNSIELILAVLELCRQSSASKTSYFPPKNDLFKQIYICIM